MIVEPLALTRGGPRSRRARKPAHLRRAGPEIERFRVLHDGHHEACQRLHGNPDVHPGGLPENPRLVVELRVETGLLRNCPHHGPHQEGQERELRLDPVAFAG